MSGSYEQLREVYKPKTVRLLLIAESPPPPADVQSSRQFYRAEKVRRDDRLFVNTIRALYKEVESATEAELEAHKEQWLLRLKRDGVYMIEALSTSQEHEATTEERRALIAEQLPHLLQRVGEVATQKTGIILIKSNVFVVAAEPLLAAGFRVLNTALVDYPGRFNQPAYRSKLRALAFEDGWRPSS